MHEIASDRVALANQLHEECVRLHNESVSDKEQLGKAQEYIQALQLVEAEHDRIVRLARKSGSKSRNPLY